MKYHLRPPGLLFLNVSFIFVNLYILSISFKYPTENWFFAKQSTVSIKHEIFSEGIDQGNVVVVTPFAVYRSDVVTTYQNSSKCVIVHVPCNETYVL